MCGTGRYISMALIVILVSLHAPTALFANLLGVQSKRVASPYNQGIFPYQPNQRFPYPNFYYQQPAFQRPAKMDKGVAYTSMGLMALMTIFNMHQQNAAAKQNQAFEKQRMTSEQEHQYRMLLAQQRHQEYMLRLQQLLKQKGMSDQQIIYILNNPRIVNSIVQGSNGNFNPGGNIQVPNDWGLFTSRNTNIPNAADLFTKYINGLKTREALIKKQKAQKCTCKDKKKCTCKATGYKEGDKVLSNLQRQALEERIKTSFYSLQRTVHTPKTVNQLRQLLERRINPTTDGRSIMLLQCDALLHELNIHTHGTGQRVRALEQIRQKTVNLKKALLSYSKNSSSLNLVAKAFVAYRLNVPKKQLLVKK